jgi:hypothetical protein
MNPLAGSWKGTYDYLEPEVKGSTRIGFTLEIFGGSSWRVRGQVLDDPITGMEGCGTIRGWLVGRHIWFQKVMPYLQVTHDPKPIALVHYLEAHYGERLAGDPGRHAVSYRGVVDPDQHRVAGTWTLPHRRLVLTSGRVIVMPFARGSWEMSRT